MAQKKKALAIFDDREEGYRSTYGLKINQDVTMIPLCQQLSPLRPDSNSRSQSASQNLKSIWKATQWMGILQLESDEVTNSGAVHAGS